MDYQRADIDIIDDESIQDFINRNKKGITLMYIEKLERYCMDKSQVCSIYASLLGKQDKEITIYKGAKFLYDALQVLLMENRILSDPKPQKKKGWLCITAQK